MGPPFASDPFIPPASRRRFSETAIVRSGRCAALTKQAGTRAELVRRGPLARADRARALAGDVAEGAPERAEALPAGLEGDLGDGQVGVAEQRRRPLDAPREQVAMRRDAEGLA